MITVENLKEIVVSILQQWLHAHSANWDGWDVRNAREFLTMYAPDYCFQKTLDLQNEMAELITSRMLPPMVCKHGICTEYGCDDPYEMCEEDDTRDLDTETDWHLLKQYIKLDGYIVLTDDECEELAKWAIRAWHESIGLENILLECENAISEIQYSYGRDLLLALTKASHVVHYHGRILEDYHRGIDEVYELATDGLKAACGIENIDRYLEAHSGL